MNETKTVKRVYKNGKEIFKCPFCTSDVFYVYTRMRGITVTHYGFNGGGADNTEMHNSLSYREQKAAYCTNCNKKIGMAKDSEEPRWDTNQTQGAHHE